MAADTSFDAEVADPGGIGVFALAHVMIGVDAFSMAALEGSSTDELSPAELIEVETDFWLGNAVDAAAGSTVEIVLPTEEELPSGTRTNVGSAFPQVDDASVAPDCQVDATPSSALVTVTAVEGVTIPGLVAYAADGLTIAILSDAEVPDPIAPADGTRFYTWISSDSDVEVAFTGTDCGPFAADLSLEPGWNFAAWVFDDTDSTYTLVNVERPDTLVATVID